MRTHDGNVDVVVIGGGPAGLSVVVLDGARPPIDKACGEGLMPDGVEALESLGVRLAANDGCAFRGIRFVMRSSKVEAEFPSGSGVGMRRTRLHNLLSERALEAGAQLLWETPATGISGQIVEAGSQTIRARWIVGADGHSSLVRRWSGLDATIRDRRRFGFRAHYPVAPWSDFMELHWGTDCQIYVTPVSPGEVCIATMSTDPSLRIAEALARFPRVQERLQGVKPSTLVRGAVTSTRRLRSVYRGNVALVGDASGSVDAITGEGLCLSFRQAAALACAIRSRDLSSYAARHRALARRPAFMAGLMVLLSGRPRLNRRVVAALARRPEVFQTMLAMHVGAAKPADFAGSILTLGWLVLGA
jgi:flavin-dependent dehydrogenase